MSEFDSNVQRCIDEHLDAVDRILSAGDMPRSERRNIIDDVETQIRDMLAEHGGRNPVIADIQAIITELDPPEAYVDHGSDARESDGHVIGRTRSWLCWVDDGTLSVVLAFMGLLILGLTLIYLKGMPLFGRYGD